MTSSIIPYIYDLYVACDKKAAKKKPQSASTH